jgi:hypothetical protein
MKYLLLIFVFSTSLAFGQNQLTETDDLKLITTDVQQSLVRTYAIRCFNNALDFHKKLFNYEPTGKIMLVLEDYGDYGNGGTSAAPFNYINIGLSPFNYSFETFPAGERIYALLNHELVHMAALDNTNKKDRFFQKVFAGKVIPSEEHPFSIFYSFLTIPRQYAPRWYHEGIASYVDTWMSGGIGEALGNYDEMFFRTKVIENTRIYNAQSLESEGTSSNFQGLGLSYVYGTRFMGYLANTYGPEKILDWVKREEGSKSFFSKQYKQVFNMPIHKGWSDWINFEKEFQNENIQLIRKNAITYPTPLTDKILGSVSYAYFDSKRNKIYVAVNYPGKVPYLAAIDLNNGAIAQLVDIKGAALYYVASVIFDEEGDKIYYTTDNNAYRDLNSYDLKTKKANRLIQDVRLGDLAFNPIDKSIWGVKHAGGYSTLVRIEKNDSAQNEQDTYNDWDQKFTFDYGEDIFDIDISPDGQHISAAVSDYRGHQKLMLYELADFNGTQKSERMIFDFDVASPQSFRFTKDGKYLMGSSFYSGISNIYRAELAIFDGEGEGIEVMSNTETGLFRPILLDSARLFVFKYTSTGFQPSIIPNQPINTLSKVNFLGNLTAQKFPELQDWYSKRPSKADTISYPEKTYNIAKEFQLNAAYPIVVGYKNFMGFGYKLNFSDPLGNQEMNLSISFTWFNGLSEDINDSDVLEEDERFHASWDYAAGNFYYSLNYNPSNFYDLFGPTKRSRKGISGGIDYSASLIWDPPISLSLDLGIAGFYGLDKSPEFQTLATTGYDDNLFLDFYGALSYSFIKNSIGAVEDEKGFSGSLQGGTAITEGKLYPNLVGNADFGIPLIIKHTSLWIRSAVGRSFSNTYNPFTRFGFAAFGNNYVDSYQPKQFRDIYSLPGLTYNDDKYIESQDFGKIMTEVILPPIRYKKLGFFNLFANWTQASIFASALVSRDYDQEYDESYIDKFVNIGAQIDTRVVLFSLLPSTFSIGFARAYDINDTQMSYDEFMISLKIL